MKEVYALWTNASIGRILRAMHLIDGRALAETIRAEVKRDVKRLGISPCLKILLVGGDPASHLYVRLKKKAADEAGITVDVAERSADAPDHELVALVETWNRDSGVQAILIQLPLPPGHDEERILSTLDPRKDADGFHPATTAITPPVHEGILRLIGQTPLRINGALTTIIANSEIFSRPLKRLLETVGASVTILSPDEVDRAVLSASDLIVTAVGRARFLRADMTKPDAVVIDVGTNKTADGKVCGDADLASYRETDAWITPVPGGVGPMTVAELLKNVVRLSEAAIKH